MNRYWINKEHNPACILFFNGWGMDQNAVSHLDSGSFDVCMFCNYNSLEPIKDDFAGYQTVVLVAWSLGVWVAEHVISQSDIVVHKNIAINGTGNPVHDSYGIPESIFSMTLQGWNETNCNRFNRRMMGGEQNLTNYSHFLSNRTPVDQQKELLCICNMVKSDYSPCHFQWDIVLVGKNDLIFPAINQLNWWKNKTKVIEMPWPHFPIGLERWEQFLTL